MTTVVVAGLGYVGLPLAIRAAQTGPHVVEGSAIDAVVARVEPTSDEVSGADAVVPLTDHDAFDIGRIAAQARYLLDCRRPAPNSENVETL